VGILNQRDIPTFVSNTWHESLFPASQVIDTFTQLAVPKRLNMWIGDHGAPEGPGLAGLPTGVPFPGLRVPMREAYDWLDYYLRGVDNGVQTWPQVNNQVMFTYQTIAIPGGTNLITVPARREPDATWDDVNTDNERWYLTDGGDTGDGALAVGPDPGWARDFIAGDLTECTAMDAVLQTGQKEWFGNPRIYELAKFERSKLLVWLTEPLTGEGDVARRIRGTATVRVTVRTTADATTLVAYLFDVAPDATARIITHEPYTPSNLTPNLDRTVDWRLQVTAYDLPVDHRLALVINSRDQLYSFGSVEGSTTTISSTSGRESVVDIPLG
jgi:predicted acyl esterase